MDPTPPPPPQVTPDYQSPSSPSRPRNPWPSIAARLMAGLMTGVAVSAIVWYLGWGPLVDSSFGAVTLWLVPSLKGVAALVLLFVPGWRSFGAGLLLSIALGVLIFI